ncbi:MAG: purine-nucleoside phosphorylase [Deltaproteobacteria bacterium]|nr:purine-nucleoside phosphorylase [Deltaproteobacteria bacterium]
MMPPDPDLQRLAERIRSRSGVDLFHLAVVFGSGLAPAELFPATDAFPYADLPGFPQVSVPGHEGRLLLGTLPNLRILQFCGRFHLYEGFSAWECAAPVRLAALLGCRKLVLTNAAGAVNPQLQPGDPLFISDHINLQGDNPLIGRPDSFVDLSCLYQRALFPSLAAAARQRGLVLREGVLAAVSGPCYETPAEVRMLAGLGADAVSMSTVAEAIVGKYLGLEVAALSLITNRAAGVSGAPLSHGEVLRQARRCREDFAALIRSLIGFWSENSKNGF